MRYEKTSGQQSARQTQHLLKLQLSGAAINATSTKVQNRRPAIQNK
jgi:hypothetical protein